MKRSEDSRIIKVPDVSASLQNASSATGGVPPVFVQRQIIEMNQQQQPAGNAGGGSQPPSTTAQISLPRVAAAAAHGAAVSAGGVTVYRSDTAGSAGTNPPAAHTGSIAVTTTPAAVSSTQQPPAAHGQSQAAQNVVTQAAATSIKPEHIGEIPKFFDPKRFSRLFFLKTALPTTPVSLPYATAGVPSIKTLTPQSGLVQGLRDREATLQLNSVHTTPVNHQKPAPHPPMTGIRTVSQANISFVNF